MQTRRGDWILTYSGVKFWPLDPRPEDISVIDIAHALSQTCRFTGHTTVPYSVAEHAVRVCELLSNWCVGDKSIAGRAFVEVVLQGLHHDDSEAYICDLSRPLKHGTELGRLYRELEAPLQKSIYLAFGLPAEDHPAVRWADDVLLRNEQEDLMPCDSRHRFPSDIPRVLIQPWSAPEAEHRFLMMNQALMNTLEALR